MFLADDIAVFALPAKSRNFGQRLFHNGRGIDEHFDADLCRVGQPASEPLERAFVSSAASAIGSCGGA